MWIVLSVQLAKTADKKQQLLHNLLERQTS